MSNKYTSVYDWLKYIKANVVGINLRELRFISMFLPHARSVKKRAVRKSSSGTCATADMSSSRSVIPANDLKSSKVNILFLLLCDRSIIKAVCEESNKQKNHSEKGVKNFFEKNRKKWPRLSVWRVDITEEMA